MSTLELDEEDSNADANQIQLSIWPGGWGICSTNPECLKVLTISHFCKIPVEVVETSNPLWGQTPYIKTNEKGKTKKTIAGHDVIPFLKQENPLITTTTEKTEWTAYARYCDQCLGDAFQYIFWLHPENFEELIRPHYGINLNWIFKLWYPERLKKQALAQITANYPELEDNMQRCESLIIKQAIICIDDLSHKLGNNDFFILKKQPTDLDAIIFSYLAPLWKIPFPYNPLKEAIINKPNIEGFLKRIMKEYFPSNDGSHVIYNQYGEAISKARSETTENRNQKILGVSVAAAAMLAYAYKLNLISLPGSRSCTQ